jgi:hypothetical protein
VSRDLSLNLLLFYGRLTLTEDPKMRVVGNIALRKIFGIKLNERIGEIK